MAATETTAIAQNTRKIFLNLVLQNCLNDPMQTRFAWAKLFCQSAPFYGARPDRGLPAAAADFNPTPVVMIPNPAQAAAMPAMIVAAASNVDNDPGAAIIVGFRR